MIDYLLDLFFDWQEKRAAKAAARSAEREENKKQKWAKKHGYGSEYKSVNKEWDKVLRILIEHATLVEYDDHIAYFELNNKKYSVWIANKYYSYGHLTDTNITNQSDIVPSPYTQYLLEKRLISELHKYKNK